MKHLITFLTAITLLACSESEEQITIDPNNQLIGSWSYAEYNEDDTITYKRVNGTISDEYTCTLKNNGSFIEHKNAGWCGTPPISFSDFEGTWQQQNNKVIIQSEYWGGTQNLKWEIIALTEEILTLKITYTE